MRLDAFLIADHATVAENKLYVHGGGITRLDVPVVPFALPILALVVRYAVEDPSDYDEHTFYVQLETPSGVRLFPDDPVGTAQIEPSALASENEEHFLQMALNFGNVPVLEAGVHILTTGLDGVETRRMALPVVVRDPSTAAPAPKPNRAARRAKAPAGRARKPR